LWAQTADLLQQTGLKAGRDYRPVVVGLDPRDTAEMAEEFIVRDTPPDMRDAVKVLRPRPEELQEMTRKLGYGFVYDAELETFAHPAVRYVLAKSGKVTAVLPAFGTSKSDLRAAIMGARLGTGATATRLILLCYGFNPATGRYSLAIWRVLTALALLTVLIMGAGLALAHWRERRRA
jgi:protein SCO1/2